MKNTPFQLGGIKPITAVQRVIPVKPSAPVSLSDKAQLIHSWLISEYEQHGKPILARDVINRFGESCKRFNPFRYVKVLYDWPLEELLDNSLLYVEEQQGAE